MHPAAASSLMNNHRLCASLKFCSRDNTDGDPGMEKNTRNSNRVWYLSVDNWFPKAEELCKYLWPTAQLHSSSIRYLGAGSSNKVFGLSIDEENGIDQNYILRIPANEQEIPQTVAILNYLNASTTLKIPNVINWDKSRDNPLQYGYIIMSRLPGNCLEDVWNDLTHKNRLQLAQQLAQIYLDIETNVNDVAGLIRVHEEDFHHGSNDLNDLMFIEAFVPPGWPSTGAPLDFTNTDEGQILLDRAQQGPAKLSVSEIMLGLFKYYIYQAQGDLASRPEIVENYLSPCQDIMEGMVQANVFKSHDNICLHHVDLLPRNIMIDFDSHGDLAITGVVDWDTTLFAPRFVNRVLPRWLWQKLQINELGEPIDSSSLSDHNSDQHHEFEALDIEKTDPFTEKGAEIREVFECAVGKDWMRDATNPHFPLARKLIQFSLRPSILKKDEAEVKEWVSHWEKVKNRNQSDALTP
ncbi:hypothetical protein BKA67DRAFT_657782 [Truncatella angustata]|uniref:Aminoglycoside phosphotransferase domain-containing protein n=1 Tax=Truncatella angustata TaxID=152316 RepID=A0A9P8ZZ66_9PEZI|nr:uncharacterized protein BKA67DRAFT_657782 [Truncatella angustata]KAH6655882.1 hypothetical protein BKA67DRAFT_657782 [Truncatella angustata]